VIAVSAGADRQAQGRVVRPYRAAPACR
jgi:hypothetical protein